MSMSFAEMPFETKRTDDGRIAVSFLGRGSVGIQMFFNESFTAIAFPLRSEETQFLINALMEAQVAE